ncbi:hypothetical protein L195_g061127 [Trifolium pratense]|uniref:Uncharacterized protein n=1 Tax=Trifolium pratense TaxID=57577 RepID=A0A2K3K7Y4_TRIPR|nr:hypothetical protein L195_g061127 [Trifolium pratense]
MGKCSTITREEETTSPPKTLRIPSRSPTKPNLGSDTIVGESRGDREKQWANAPGPQERKTPHLHPKP